MLNFFLCIYMQLLAAMRGTGTANQCPFSLLCPFFVFLSCASSCALISFKMACSLRAPFPPRLGSLPAVVHYRPASSRKRKAPTEPAISTLFCWSGPSYWFRSGSTSGSYSCCLSLWLVTHTHTHTLPFPTHLLTSAVLRLMLRRCFSVGAEEAGGALWPEELCRADSHRVVGGAGEVWTGARGGPAAGTNQRLGSVPAAYRHKGNVSD